MSERFPPPCQPIGCDNGIHLEGCVYVTIDKVTEALLREKKWRLYVSDEGRLRCNDENCDCDGDINFDKRRMDLDDFLFQLLEHFKGGQGK